MDTHYWTLLGVSLYASAGLLTFCILHVARAAHDAAERAHRIRREK